MRLPVFGKTFGKAMSLFVEGWRIQIIIYGTTLLVAVTIALVADIGFRLPTENVVQLSVVCTVALLILVPSIIIRFKDRSIVRQRTSKDAVKTLG